MDRLWSVLKERKWWPIVAAVLALLVLVPRIGAYGFWDPQEIQIADQAQQITEDGESYSKVVPNQSPFTVWAVATGIQIAGTSELGARFPLVLLGLIVVAATFLMGERLAGRRAALISAVVMLATPMLVFESRQLISAIGAVAGSTLVMTGLVGFAWPGEGNRTAMLAWRAADAVMIALGSVIAYFAVGVVAGVLVPVIAAAVATGMIAWSRDEGDRVDDTARSWLRISAPALAVATGVSALWIVLSVFDVVDAYPGDRAVFGKTLRAGNDYVQALGGTWRQTVPPTVTWDAMFEQIAFGFFPWIALAPFALGRAAMGRGGGRRSWAGYAVVLWALLAWAAGTLLTLKTGPMRYTAFPALALAVGIWLDDLLRARDCADDPAPLPLAMPLAGLAVFLVAVMLGKDLKSFPGQFAALHLVDGTIKFPTTVSSVLRAVPILFGALIGGALWLGLWLPRRPDAPWSPPETGGKAAHAWREVVAAFATAGYHIGRVASTAARHGVHAALALGLVFALTLSWVYTPALSRAFSYKYLFDRYQDLRKSGDKLGILGMPGSGPKYYAKGDFEHLRNRNQLFEFLKQDSARAFAMVPGKDLCAIHQGMAKEGATYHVLDDSHAKFLLVSNRLRKGEKDRNPLQRFLLREPPQTIKQPLSINFNDEIEIVGVNMPTTARRGAKFEMTLFYKVLKKPTRNWQVFVHFDGGGMRFQGDHWPVNNQCGTSYWQPGDYVVDTFQVDAGDGMSPLTRYTVWAGFFVGSHGNWTNMTAKDPGADDNNRVRIGELRLK